MPKIPMEEFVRFQRTIHEPYWMLIGEFVTTFGTLESNIDWALGAMLKIHPRQSDAVFAQMQSVKGKCKLLEKLCSLITKDKDYRSRIKKLSSNIESINAYRNKLIHGPWRAFVEEKKTQYWQKIYVNPQNFKYKSFNDVLSELREKRNSTITTSVSLVNLTQEILRNSNSGKGEQPTSP